METVLWICKQIEEEEFFYTEPFPLSQSVLLALLEQLARDFNQHKEIKLSWIQRILIKLDTLYFKREGLLPHLQPVLNQVQENLNNAQVASKQRSRLEVVKAVLSSVLYEVSNN